MSVLPTTLADSDVGHLDHHEEIHTLLGRMDGQTTFLATGLVQDVIGNRPAAGAGNAGLFYFATDTPSLGYSDGVTWREFLHTEDDQTAFFASGVPWIDPRSDEYGAVGDGVTDDGAALQDALADLGSTGVLFIGGGVFLTSVKLQVGARQRIVGNSPDDSVVHGNANDTVVELIGDRAGLESLRVRTSNGGSSVKAVEVDAVEAGTGLEYLRLRDVVLSADSKVSGQVGLRFVNDAATNIYYAQISDLLIENFGVGIGVTNDTTFGINAVSITNLKIHNANTCIDLDDANGWIVTNFLLDLYTVGINCDGVRNIFLPGRMEGGGGDTAYTFGATSQENVLMAAVQTGAGSSTDAGSNNMVWNLAVGAAKPWDLSTKWIAPFHPLLADGGGTIPVGANNAQFVKLDGITKAMNLTAVRVELTNSPGAGLNHDIGLYEFDGTDLVRRASTGSIAVPATSGAYERSFTAGYIVDPRKVYYVGIAADSTTPQWRAKTSIPAAMIDVTSANISGRLLYATSGGGMMPLPTTVAVAGLSTDSKAFCPCLQ